MEEKYEPEHFASKIIFFLLAMITELVLYPVAWNSLCKRIHKPYINGFPICRWDYVAQSREGLQIAIAIPFFLMALALYINSEIKKSKNKGKLVANGTEYGSARFSSDEELHAYFITTTITPKEKKNKLFKLWRYKVDKKDSKF